MGASILKIIKFFYKPDDNIDKSPVMSFVQKYTKMHFNTESF